MISEFESRLIATAREAYNRGAWAGAIDRLKRLPPETKSSPDVLLIYGTCLARLRRVEEASSMFLELLAQDPDCYEALTWMAVLKRNQWEIEEAVEYANRAVHLGPEDATGYGSLGSCYLYQQNAELAILAFLDAVRLDPKVAEHEHNLGLAYQMAHQIENAIRHLQMAISLAPQNPQSYLDLVGAYNLYGLREKALECLLEGLSNIPNSVGLHVAAGAAFTAIRNDKAAESHYLRALELSPEARGVYATWLLNQGRFDEANALYEAMIDDNSDPAYAYHGIMQSRKLTPGDSEFVEDMEGQLENGCFGAGREMYLEYAIGRAKEQLGEFGSAMEHFDSANRLAFSVNRSGHPLPPSQFENEHRPVQALFESLKRLSPGGSPSQAPIFIVGMIRSGTTLLDQIVSSHSQISSGGELQFWIEESLRLVAEGEAPTQAKLDALAEQYLRYVGLSAGDSRYTTDKTPLNFAYVGIINAALPNACFLHIRRNPIDTCLSIYTTYFGKGALFAYKKQNIVAAYREYQRMMNYWRGVLSKDRLLELDYEELIANPRVVIPQVIEFCGLPWEEACFHHDKDELEINTPSRWQARQPLYSTSIDRWKRYEKVLGEFAEFAE